MFIEIQELKPEPLHIHHVFPVGEIDFVHEDAMLDEPVTADFTLRHKGLDLYVDGFIKTRIQFRCSRCGKAFSRPFFTEFDLSYLPQPQWSNDDLEIEPKYEDLDIAFYDGVAFDVNLMVLEQIELAMPMKFVCKEDCKGLCYKCGADLNEGECGCSREIDPRLSVLLDFNKRNKRDV